MQVREREREVAVLRKSETSWGGEMSASRRWQVPWARSTTIFRASAGHHAAPACRDRANGKFGPRGKMFESGSIAGGRSRRREANGGQK